MPAGHAASPLIQPAANDGHALTGRIYRNAPTQSIRTERASWRAQPGTSTVGTGVSDRDPPHCEIFPKNRKRFDQKLERSEAYRRA
jgi:hypothetical protein